MLHIKDIKKSFGDLAVLKGISAEVQEGEIIAIIGPSGSGKSTLLRTINLMEVPDSGVITYKGIEISPKPKNLRDIRQKIGMVFQHFHLFPHMTVLQNVTYAPIQVLQMTPQDAEERAQALLKQVGVLDKQHVYPAQLSGGQKQRVAIARCLAMNPEVVLFDEPTSALDPEMVKEVLDVIKSLSKTGITMLIVTHEMNFARDIADKIWFFDQGQLIEEQSPALFFKKPETDRAKSFLEKVL
ncbi:MAG: amino acid ABC transporter ATP-binding protein [Candidatus Nucleicultricaceae bacterium]